jgi:hypothetical protein
MKLFVYLITLCFMLGISHAEEERLLLITGCGRSGTTYIVKLLEKNGIILGHERIKKDGTGSWYAAVNGVINPFLRPGEKKGDFSGPFECQYHKCHFQHIFHQVRDPLSVISSWYYNRMKAWEFIYANVPQIKRHEPHLAKCAKYWYYWNLKAEKIAEWRYRIEDINKIFEEMAQRLKRPLDRSTLKLIEKDSNARNKDFNSITWKDLRQVLSRRDFINLQRLARKYGYATRD